MGRTMRRSPHRLTVTKVHRVEARDGYWWADVDATGPKGGVSLSLAFHTEAEARGCVGMVFKRTPLGRHVAT